MMAFTVESARPAGRRLRQVVFAIIALTVIAYSAAVVRLMMQETELIFRTAVARADTRPTFPYTQIDLPRTDGARQFAWRLERAAEGTNGHGGDWVLYLHGNASTVASRMNVNHYTRLHELGVNVLAPEYRGYNGLPGVPSEATVIADARAAYDYLRNGGGVPADRIVIFGWSLGGAIAVSLASAVEARGVVLEGTPASIVDIGAARYPMFPVRWIIRNPFNAIDRVRGIRVPILFLHSPEDAVVPFAEGRRLFDAATAPKTFVEVRGGHIESSEVDRDVFYGAVRSFLQATSTPPPSH
jgi:fermentation-respiration switch protein FrsA (DUF1100 family)